MTADGLPIVPTPDPALPRVELQTRNGTILLTDTTKTSLRCGCGANGGGIATLEAMTTAQDGRPISFTTGLCGNCLSEALAILFGRRHVQHGGTVGDLDPAEL